jgi:predicted RNase H-like HicB family nuclease
LQTVYADIGHCLNLANFTIIYKVDEEVGGYSGQCLEIPGAISEGETLEELRTNMIDAITLVIKSMDREAQGRRMVIEVPTT